MLLTLNRLIQNDEVTIGELLIDGARECVTLEDPVRAVKIKHQTAIPAGTYEVVLSFSQRFQQVMPLLLAVPGFEGIRIHPGNTTADTSGCLLVGRAVAPGEDAIAQSRVAYRQLMSKLRQAATKGKILITINNKPAT